jgi:hypothetical protein
VYPQVCLALKDDYEIVCQMALELVWVLGQPYPEKWANLGVWSLFSFVNICA